MLEYLGRSASECLLAGDSLGSDITMGKQAGITTVLVLTGVARRADLDGASVQPDAVLNSLAELPRWITLEA